jgi:hypothetical protein
MRSHQLSFNVDHCWSALRLCEFISISFPIPCSSSSSLAILLHFMFASPHYHLRALTSSLLDSTTYLFWPSPYFESEFLFQENPLTSQREWIEITQQKNLNPLLSEGNGKQKKGGYFPTISLSQRKPKSTFSPLSWRVGVIADCYVAICCTEQSSIDASHHKNALFQVSSSFVLLFVPLLTPSHFSPSSAQRRNRTKDPPGTSSSSSRCLMTITDCSASDLHALRGLMLGSVWLEMRWNTTKAFRDL